MLFEVKAAIADDKESFDAANERLYAAGFTDGLPVIPPTRERIERMLGERDPQRKVATLAPMMAEATNEAIASCAVLAGCRPEHMPVLIAAVEAVAEPQFNLLGVQTTTGSAAVCLFVNGPIVKHLAINFDVNALGPGVRANAAIGRALVLVLRNVGGATPGELDMSTMGQPGKYTFCFAENEAASRWEPFHVSRGYTQEESTVTAIAVAGTMEVRDECSPSARSLLTTFSRSMLAAGSAGNRGLLTGNEPLILLAPDHARIIANDMTRKEAQAFVYQSAQLPVERLSPEMQAHLRKSDISSSDMLRVSRSPEDILFVVVGGAGNKSTYIPSWGGETRSVTKRIDVS